MERLGDTFTRMKLVEFSRRFPPEAPEEATPVCPLCRDRGFVRHDVEIGHPDFGRAFPCVCQIDELRDRLRRRSNLGSLTHKTFATFDVKGREGLTVAARKKLREAAGISGEYGKAPLDWLVLTGPSGCGKTHLAAAIANRQIESGSEAFFTFVPDLMDHLRSTYAPGTDVSYDELFQSVRTAPLLVLDDLGSQSGSPWAQEKLFQILNHRYNSALPTVITTSRRLGELDDWLRTRLEDRNICQVVEVSDWISPLVEQPLGGWSKKMRQQRLDTFQTAPPGSGAEQRKLLDRALSRSAAFARNPDKWLVLVGEGGRGKTHLAAAIKNARDPDGKPTLFVTVPDLLQYLRATYAPDSKVKYDHAFESVKNAEVLILDDYGAHSSTQWAQEKLFQLLNHRFNHMLPTVITTNVPFDRSEIQGDPPEARILSRLLDDSVCTVIRLDVPRYRRRDVRASPQTT
jgi:DNA replication protein DnaC